jgi:hypothetical protein
MSRTDRLIPDPRQDTVEQPCDAPGCAETAAHKAPRARDRLNEYYWFCREHAREYNRAWNYCAGMTEQDIEKAIRLDTVWRRPTWPLNAAAAEARRSFEAGDFADAFGFGDEFRRRSDDTGNGTGGGPGELYAMRTMALRPPLTLTRLKARYKELVKQLHPDANGGDRAAEDRLKEINEAYATLKQLLSA